MTATSPVANPNWVAAVDVNTEVEAFSAWLDIHDLEKFTVMCNAVKSGSPGNLTVTLEVSQDSVAQLNATNLPSGTTVVSGDYDKIITDAGVDAPAVSAVFSADGHKTFSKSPEDSIRSVRLGYVSAATTNGTNYWTVNAGYSGLPRK